MKRIDIKKIGYIKQYSSVHHQAINEYEQGDRE